MSSSKCYSYLRFSRPEQSKGDSTRRQTERAQEYAISNKLTLDTELTFEDRGLSAFTGEHRKKGALGNFLMLIQTGKIPKGSTLIVESLDRLSREQVLDAFDQFREIMKGGIKIVTLTDGMEYCEKTVANNIGQLMISLTIMSRAYEESLEKSKRLKSAWSNKRKNLNTVKLTSISPAWLKLNDDKSTFEVDKNRVLIIKEIFDKSVNGYGIAKIAKDFNERGLASWKKKGGWHSSYIHKILRNRAVIGEFQPHILEDGKRVPEGEPLSDYFPKIIDEPLFYQVQNRLKANASYSGKTGNISNLFGGLAKCGYCNASMQYVNKGQRKGGKYLVCDSGRRGRGCDYILLKYEELEEAILTLCKEIDLDLIFSDDTEEYSRQVEELTKTIEASSELIAKVDKRLVNLTNTLADEENMEVSRIIKEKMRECTQEIEVLKNQKEKAANAISEIVHEKEKMRDKVDDIKTLYQNGSMQDIDKRLRLRSNLRSILSNIIIYPAGKRVDEEFYQKVLEVEKKHRKNSGHSYDEEEITRRVQQSLFYGINDKQRRSIRLNFKNDKIMTLDLHPNTNLGYYMSCEIDGEQVFLDFMSKSPKSIRKNPPEPIFSIDEFLELAKESPRKQSPRKTLI